MNIPVILIFVFLGYSQGADFPYPSVKQFEVYGPPEKSSQNFTQDATVDVDASLTSENNENLFAQKLETVESKLDNLLDVLMPRLVKLMDAYTALEPVLSKISENQNVQKGVDTDTVAEQIVSQPYKPSPPSIAYGLEIPEVFLPRADVRFRKDDIEKSLTPR